MSFLTGFPEDCIFCQIREYPDLATTGVEIHNTHMILRPLREHAPGHFMVIPKEHVEDALINPMVTARTFAQAANIVADMHIEANIIASVGTAATQSVPHLHVHVIPRSTTDGLHERWPWRDSEVRSALQAYIDGSMNSIPCWGPDANGEHHFDGVSVESVLEDLQGIANLASLKKAT